ncbi:hypothetical protein ACFE04_018300 [Oxalis oulophora]
MPSQRLKKSASTIGHPSQDTASVNPQPVGSASQAAKRTQSSRFSKFFIFSQKQLGGSTQGGALSSELVPYRTSGSCEVEDDDNDEVDASSKDDRPDSEDVPLTTEGNSSFFPQGLYNETNLCGIRENLEVLVSSQYHKKENRGDRRRLFRSRAFVSEWSPINRERRPSNKLVDGVLHMSSDVADFLERDMLAGVASKRVASCSFPVCLQSKGYLGAWGYSRVFACGSATIKLNPANTSRP